MTVISAPDQSDRRARLAGWDPEDVGFWNATGERIAKRNLLASVFSEHIGFSIWAMWSVLVLFLGKDYGFAPEQKFLLTAVPALVGSVLRIPYTLAVSAVGGRRWTMISSALLLVPTLATAAVLQPGVSFGVLLAVAALAGFGGGNFASSMANINAFYPQRLKGWALGINAGAGNLGVAVVQLVGIAVLAFAGAGQDRRPHAAARLCPISASIDTRRQIDRPRPIETDSGESPTRRGYAPSDECGWACCRRHLDEGLRKGWAMARPGAGLGRVPFVAGPHGRSLQPVVATPTQFRVDSHSSCAERQTHDGEARAAAIHGKRCNCDGARNGPRPCHRSTPGQRRGRPDPPTIGRCCGLRRGRSSGTSRLPTH